MGEGGLGVFLSAGVLAAEPSFQRGGDKANPLLAICLAPRCYAMVRKLLLTPLGNCVQYSTRVKEAKEDATFDELIQAIGIPEGYADTRNAVESFKAWWAAKTVAQHVFIYKSLTKEMCVKVEAAEDTYNTSPLFKAMAARCEAAGGSCERDWAGPHP